MEGPDRSAPKPKMLNCITSYTREQKIVAAVWYSERLFTGMSLDQLKQNFLVRFKTDFPKQKTLKKWKKDLFKNGNLPDKYNKVRSRTTLARLVYVPYVKASLVRFPELTLRARASFLGMSANTLDAILKKDLKANDLADIKVDTIDADVNDSNIVAGYENKFENEDVDIQSDEIS